MEHLLSSANIEQLTKQVIEFVITAPSKYKTWWNNLYSDSPEHIFIETGLILFIIWLVFIRSTIDPTKAATNAQLTERDIGASCAYLLAYFNVDLYMYINHTCRLSS